MFTKDGMQICKAKSSFKRLFQIKVSRRKVGVADVTVIDGLSLQWTMDWPEDGSVAYFFANVKKRITFSLTNSDVYLIFDRYHDYSIRSTSRDGMESGVTRKHNLLRTTKLPAQKIVLQSVDNKKKLVWIIFEELTQDRLFHQQFTRAHRLVVTWEDTCPIEMKNEDWCIRTDLDTYQEEADVIIVQQVLKSIGEASQVTVISDDTDAFVLLVHHYHGAGLDVPLKMESPSRDRAILGVNATITKHKDVRKAFLRRIPCHCATQGHHTSA
jgi:hypothetical protein